VRETLDDTIAAICTPPGEGGVGIVRLSGPESLPIAARLFASSTGRTVAPGKRAVYHGHIRDEDGRLIDEVLLHVMPAPKTFTREDVVEINGHGGSGPLNALLEAVLARGARLARPGEFTLRAFLNGRIDLVQAEAVLDQVQARTRAGLHAANAAAQGALSQDLHRIQDALRFALSRIEAAVDFPEEDLGELVDPALLEGLEQTHREMEAMLAAADKGRLLREGAVVVIGGRPNVGKSSLFNALLRDNRAIVSAQAGTTRDRLEEYLSIGGVPVRLVDTAGLRDTEDEVERIGVARAREAVEQAHVALLVLDSTAAAQDEEAALAAELARDGRPVILAMNKRDLAPDAPPPAWPTAFAAVCPVSAVTGEGLPDLESALADVLLGGAGQYGGEALLNRVHQKDSLRRAAACVARLLASPEVSPEFLAFELQEALQAVGEITGETTPDDILETIFASFCIGK